MQGIIGNALKATATVATIWIGYNMLIFAEIAAGKHVEYIPYLHLPIKLVVLALALI